MFEYEIIKKIGVAGENRNDTKENIGKCRFAHTETIQMGRGFHFAGALNVMWAGKRLWYPEEQGKSQKKKHAEWRLTAIQKCRFP